MEPTFLHKLEKHKFVEWGLGAAVLIIAFLALRSRSAAKAGTATGVTYQQQDTGLSSAYQNVLKAVTQNQAGIAAITENQITSAGVENRILGASSWLTCCNPLDWHCDASCFKQKGGTTAGVPGSGNVTNLKTQEKQTIAQFAAPFSGCLSGGGYDLGCVGSLIAGSPTYNKVTAQTDATKAVRQAPQPQPVGLHA